MDRPSIERAVACGLVSLPWIPAPISLGRGFHSGLAGEAKANPFCWSDSAFGDDALRSIPIVYHPHDDCRGTYVSAATARSTYSTDHMSLSLGVGIGNEYLGASVTGSYNNSVLDNKALTKSSRRSSFFAGDVHFVKVPPLSQAARELLSDPDGGLERFRSQYGDFYVSALVLGADAGIMMSQASNAHASKEQIKLEGEAHFLCWSDTETLAEKDISEATSDAQFGITAFDTVNDSYVDLQLQDGDGLSFEEARWLSKDYLERVENLGQRIRDLLKHWPQLQEGSERKLFWTDVESLARSGLISRIILSPFDTHREVREHLRAQED